MCGIAGLYTFDPRPDRIQIHNIVQNMTDALQHRGPDDSGIWQDPDTPLALGHRRLSILDLSPLGKQPMESATSRYIITFNGEIYNFKTIRSELESLGNTTFRGQSDTEVLLGAIDYWGLQKTLSKLNGMFAFSLWDRKTKALYFARDRFGKKPLYIGWAGSTLTFGSELKALCTHPDFNRDISREALTSYMRFGYVPAPFSIYKQVWQLLPGSYIALDLTMLRAGQDLDTLMEYYWRPKDTLEKAKQAPINPEHDMVGNLETILSDCIKDRMIADVPLGAFLSGGIDSTTIVSLMQKNSTAPVQTYTIGFEEHGFNEAQHAQEIATHLGTDHHELYLKPQQALDLIPQIPQMYDEPFADASALPTYLVSKFARDSVTVALSGDGGDEMFGGYNRHITGPKAWNFTQNHMPAPLRTPLSNIIQAIPTHIWDKIRNNRPQFGNHMHKFAKILTKQSESDVYLSLTSTFQSPKDIIKNGHEETIPLVNPNLQIPDLTFAEDMMYWDVISYLNGDILTKVDRASMATGLEARAPFLDRRIYDYVWRLPVDAKIKNGNGKWILKEVLKRHVPDTLFQRPKQGFSVPIDKWLREDLKDWAEDLLDEKFLQSQNLFDYKEVRMLWEQHLKGRGAHAQKLWTILMFQAWYKHWIVQ
ncbi:MAG: asparagine synthase (glutamine-hydrolyzing) [Alphaproteobacteria bacterium]